MLNYVNPLILKGKVKCLNLKENRNVLPPINTNKDGVINVEIAGAWEIRP